MPAMLLLAIGLSANGYAPLTPRPCTPVAHASVLKRPFGPVAIGASRDGAHVQMVCPFVSLPASDVHAVVVRREIQLAAPVLFRMDRAERAELHAAVERRGALRNGGAVLITITDALRSRTAGPGP